MFAFNPPIPDTFEEEMLADWSEDQKKEREVILSSRYVHTYACACAYPIDYYNIIAIIGNMN